MTGLRCGRCIAGEHGECVESLTMGPPRHLYVWRCGCDCRTAGPPGTGSMASPRP